MGIFGSKKEKVYKVKGTYYSSHPDIKNQKVLCLEFSESGVKVFGKKNDLIKQFSWKDIVSFETAQETKEQYGQRITATRMATMGVFSLAAPKKTGTFAADIIDVLKTSSGDIVLETKMGAIKANGLAGSMTQYAVAAHTKESKNIQRFVGDHTTP